MPDTTIHVDESRHWEARQKLGAVAYLLSQTKMETQIEDNDMHGLALIIRECLPELRDVDAPEVQ